MQRVEEIMGRFSSVVEDPYRTLATWKRRFNRKIIGCLPMYVPEELVHAAGMPPVVLQESNETITEGASYVQTFFCGFVRSIVDIAAKGNLDFLDGIVIADTCDPIRKIFPVLERNLHLDYYETLYLPPTVNRPASRAYAMGQFVKLKNSLQEFALCRISDASLRQSITVYNKNRALLRALYALRRDKPGLFPARDISTIVVAGMLMPKEKHNELLETLLAGTGDWQPPAGTGPRLVISGSLCRAVPIEVLDLIEEAGVIVIDDDLYAGSRYFSADVEEDGNPLESLVDRYLLGGGLPCPTRIDLRNDWGDYIVGMARNVGAHGVVNLLVKYCEPHSVYYPQIRQKLLAAGIPELALELDHGPVPLGQIKSRLEAFVEMISGR